MMAKIWPIESLVINTFELTRLVKYLLIVSICIVQGFPDEDIFKNIIKQQQIQTEMKNKI